MDEAVRAHLADVVDFVSPHHYQEIAKFGADGVEEMRRYIVSRGMPVAFTEWNLDGQDMRTGLFTGGFLNMLAESDAVAIRDLDFTASGLVLPAFSATVVEAARSLGF